MNKPVTLVLALVAGGLLAACGGGGAGVEPVPVAIVPAATTLTASPTTTAAVVGTPFTFATGVPELGTSASTTIVFSQSASSTAPAPDFTISSGAQSAKGSMAFGSCIFKITESTFPADHKMAAGNTLEINPCNIKVDTSGMAVDAPAQERSVALLLGSAASTGTPVPIDVNPAGELTVNGKPIGTVTVTFVTGT